MNTEERFTEILEIFKTETKRAVEDAVTEIHGGWLPYVEGDTESNVNERSADVIRCILQGNFEVEDSILVVMVDGINCRIRIETEGFYTRILDSIVQNMAECPKDLKIKNLELRIKSIENDIRNY